MPSQVDERDYSVCAVPMAFPEKFIIEMDKNYNQEHGTCVAQSARGVFREHFGAEFGTAFLYGGGTRPVDAISRDNLCNRPSLCASYGRT